MGCFIFLLKAGERLGSYKKCQKTETRRMGRAMSTDLFVQTIPDKLFEAK